jgi:small subunit ribosomal protein S20
MPITKGAKKALRQSLKKRELNLRYKRRFRGLVKEFRDNVLKSNIEDAKKKLPLIFKALDKAAKHGTIKKNTASRYKARLSRKISPPTSKAPKPE